MGVAISDSVANYSMEPSDDEFMSRHSGWWPDLSGYQELRRAVRSITDFDALDDAIKREFLNKLGVLSHDHYYVPVCGSPCGLYYASPYDEDAGLRALKKAYRVATRKLRLSRFDAVCVLDSQKEARRDYEDKRQRGTITTVGNFATTDYPVTCMHFCDTVLFALQRNGNYMKDGQRIPEAARLFDELKERHAYECIGCRYE